MKLVFVRRRQSGQTLIIALIILGLLLILGFVFLGIVDRNIKGGATALVRSESNDLAEAGVRYAQSQLLSSPLGADWRGTPVTLTPVAGQPNETRDPDAYYLRPATYLPMPNNANQEDLGGPDGLGPFIRLSFDQGRALVRVRYGPSDINLLSSSPYGPIRTPGIVHSYTIIDAVGRQGVVNLNDPTTQAQGNPIQFQNYASTAALGTALAALQQYDSQQPNSRHLLAYSTSGVTDYARFITNIYNVTRAADIGVPDPVLAGGGELPGLGMQYNGTDVGSLLTYQLGTSGTIAAPSTNAVPLGFGSFMSNADLAIHGNVLLNLNASLGDGFRVAGNIGADDNSVVTINSSTYNQGTNAWTTAAAATFGPPTGAGAQIVSRSAQFTTDNGLVQDGMARADALGYPSGVGKLPPPSMLQTDPQTKVSRYLELTRDSGYALNGFNTGEYGHGQGPYVDNTNDQQIPQDESGRAGVGSLESLPYDWLNPNNGGRTTGWRGSFYVPVGAYLSLLDDGFTITRDDTTWKNPDGSDSGQSTLKFRIGLVNGKLYIVNGLEINNIDAPTAQINFTAGQPFNGVLYFEGNVRTRGTIPADVQLTVVSGGSIYIEGSITRGILGNDVTDGYASSSSLFANYGTALTRPSKSMLMLIAKDYVALNTTQFTGLSPSQPAVELNDTLNNTGYNPIVMSNAGGTANGEIDLLTEFLTDPTVGTATNPSTWRPYALGYNDAISGNPLNTKLLLTHTMSDGAGAASLISMNINLGTGGTANQAGTEFPFPGTGTALPYSPILDNTASDYLGTGATTIPEYGLGKDTWQRYDKFESRAFNLVYGASSSWTAAQQTILSTNSAATGISYGLFAPGTNDILIRPNSIVGVPTNDYLLARAAVTPGDITIEASVYAEEGSFFVIPGNWFDPDPNDTRAAYAARVATLSSGGGGLSAAQAQQEADLERMEAFGNAPEVPFYGEPLDIRVQLIGSIAENMPPPESQQSAWIQKWGWMPIAEGADGASIPATHVPAGTNAANTPLVPNIIVSYDPELATGRTDGITGNDNPATPTDLIRTDSYGRALPPFPRMPVSPVLTYFGEVQ